MRAAEAEREGDAAAAIDCDDDGRCDICWPARAALTPLRSFPRCMGGGRGAPLAVLRIWSAGSLSIVIGKAE